MHQLLELSCRVVCLFFIFQAFLIGLSRSDGIFNAWSGFAIQLGFEFLTKRFSRNLLYHLKDMMLLSVAQV